MMKALRHFTNFCMSSKLYVLAQQFNKWVECCWGACAWLYRCKSINIHVKITNKKWDLKQNTCSILNHLHLQCTRMIHQGLLVNKITHTSTKTNWAIFSFDLARCHTRRECKAPLWSKQMYTVQQLRSKSFF